MINYNKFLKTIPHTTEDLSGEIFDSQLNRIRIKKRRIAVKNLTRIFEATLSLSNSKGFRSMSLRDLSKEVGITMGGLYLYFKSKDDLIDLIQNQSIRMTKRIVETIDITTEEPQEALGKAIRYYLYLSEAHRPWFYFLYMETKNFSPAQKKRAVDLELFVENIFKEILERGRVEGLFILKDTRLAASMINALLMDWFLKRPKYFKRKISVDKYAARIIDTIECIVLPAVK